MGLFDKAKEKALEAKKMAESTAREAREKAEQAAGDAKDKAQKMKAESDEKAKVKAQASADQKSKGLFNAELETMTASMKSIDADSKEMAEKAKQISKHVDIVLDTIRKIEKETLSMTQSQEKETAKQVEAKAQEAKEAAPVEPEPQEDKDA